MFKIFLYNSLNGALVADMGTTTPSIKGDFIELAGDQYEVLARVFNYSNDPYNIKLTVKKVNI